MDNSNCYWCDYDINKIDTPEEGYYCTFDLDNIHLCPLDESCNLYCPADNMPEYIRNLVRYYKQIERWFLKLP